MTEKKHSRVSAVHIITLVQQLPSVIWESLTANWKVVMTSWIFN